MNKNKQVTHCKQETFTNPSAPSNISPGPFDSRRCLKFRVGDIYLRSCVSRDICQRGLDVIKSNCFCYFIQNKRFYIERKLTVCNSFRIFMFVDQLLLVDVFLSCTILPMPKHNHQAGPPLSIVKIMKNRYY